jgi:pimeloyl-ACP methyl ester carboxylesterase
MGHSFGSLVSSRLVQLHPKTAVSLTLLDPVCFAMVRGGGGGCPPLGCGVAVFEVDGLPSHPCPFSNPAKAAPAALQSGLGALQVAGRPSTAGCLALRAAVAATDASPIPNCGSHPPPKQFMPKLLHR